MARRTQSGVVVCGFGFGLQGCVDAELVYLLRATFACWLEQVFLLLEPSVEIKSVFSRASSSITHTHTHIHVRKHTLLQATKKLMKCTKTVNVIIPFDHWKLSKESILTLRKDV